MYTIRFFDEPARFLEEMRSQFELYETRNSLIHGVATKLAGDSKAYGPEQPLLAVVWNDLGIACFSALMTPPNPLIVQSEVDDGEAVSLFCTAALEAGWAIPGVNGPSDVSEVVSAEFQRQTGRLAVLKERMLAYELTKVFPPADPGGLWRKATKDDDLAVLQMAWAMGDELRVYVRPAWTLASIQRVIQFGAVYVWEVEDRPVSIAMRNRPTRHAITVSNVYTLPEFRGKGYASANVAAFCQQELAHGYQLVNLFTDSANPVSNHVYQKIGFKPVCKYARFDFGE